jgi:hypothetical protein
MWKNMVEQDVKLITDPHQEPGLGRRGVVTPLSLAWYLIMHKKNFLTIPFISIYLRRAYYMPDPSHPP